MGHFRSQNPELLNQTPSTELVFVSTHFKSVPNLYFNHLWPSQAPSEPPNHHTYPPYNWSLVKSLVLNHFRSRSKVEKKLFREESKCKISYHLWYVGFFAVQQDQKNWVTILKPGVKVRKNLFLIFCHFSSNQMLPLSVNPIKGCYMNGKKGYFLPFLKIFLGSKPLG